MNEELYKELQLMEKTEFNEELQRYSWYYKSHQCSGERNEKLMTKRCIWEQLDPLNIKEDFFFTLYVNEERYGSVQVKKINDKAIRFETLYRDKGSIIDVKIDNYNNKLIWKRRKEDYDISFGTEEDYDESLLMSDLIESTYEEVEVTLSQNKIQLKESWDIKDHQRILATFQAAAAYVEARQK